MFGSKEKYSLFGNSISSRIKKTSFNGIMYQIYYFYQKGNRTSIDLTKIYRHFHRVFVVFRDILENLKPIPTFCFCLVQLNSID